jgi:hypothetical protein
MPMNYGGDHPSQADVHSVMYERITDCRSVPGISCQTVDSIIDFCCGERMLFQFHH